MSAPRVGVAQHLVEPPFGLAGEERDAHGARTIEIGVDAAEHADRAGHVEAADRDRDAALAQRPGEIERARELVRLHADQHHHAGAGRLDQRRETARVDARVGLVEGMDVDLDVGAEHAPLGAVLGEPVERGERVRRNGGTRATG